MYDAKDDYNLMGFLRIDDLVSNVEIGGGYLWITANQRLLRAPLALSSLDPSFDKPDEADTSPDNGTNTDTDSSTAGPQEKYPSWYYLLIVLLLV
mmetsp:Transcript_10678/g.23633  ORF Transcript_10678/g.23633 Transcript_10678/m.23633 type:complete len:95 (-) Transcript_10678:112-396(-)